MSVEEHTIKTQRMFATIIGIDEYDHDSWIHLDGPSRDARAVYDALKRTRMSVTLANESLIVSDSEVSPKRAVILDVLKQIAAQADKRDIVLIFFAGHGVIADGHASLAPADGNPNDPDSLISIALIQQIFEDCKCSVRWMLLDCCLVSIQDEASSKNDTEQLPTAKQKTITSRGYRTRGSVSSQFIDSLHLANRREWTILTSCGPNQESVETDELEGHGIFSYYVALGLRGDADLDKDNTVGIGELAQYVSNNVSREVYLASGGFKQQTPELICSGPIASFTDEGAAAGDALPPDRRIFTPPKGLWKEFWQAIRGHLPFEETNNWRYHFPGACVLYGLLMGLEIVLLLDIGGKTGWTISFSIASTIVRYHHGGYLSAIIIFVWHVLLFFFFSALTDNITNIIRFGVTSFFILCVMIIFGINTLYIALSLFDLERRNEEGALRDFFRELGQKYISAEFPNPIPCESIHPKLYRIVLPIAILPLLVHMIVVLWQENLIVRDGLLFLRDMLFAGLIIWFYSGYNALYMWLNRRHPKKIRS